MTLSFSSEQMKTILNSDTGLNDQLKGLSPDQSEYLRNLLSDGDVLNKLLQLVPELYKPQIELSLKKIIETPQKAQQLFEQCRYVEARKLIEESIAIYSQLPRTTFDFLNSTCNFVCTRLQALLLNLLGDVEWEIGNSQSSKEKYQNSVDLAQACGDQDTYAKSLGGIGKFFQQTGDYDKALSVNLKALDIISDLPDRWNIQNQILSNLCSIYTDLGQEDEALEYAELAINLCKQNGDTKNLPLCCNNLGCFYVESGDMDQAEKIFNTGLTAARENQNIYQEIQILTNQALSLALLKKGRTPQTDKECFSLLNKALLKSNNINSRFLKATMLLNSGFVQHLMEDDSQTTKMLEEAAALFGSIASKSNEALSLNILGNHLKNSQNNPREASIVLGKSITITESIRHKLKREVHKISYADMIADPYEMVIKCHFDLNQPEIALNYIERAKSKSLIDLLSGHLQIDGKGKFDQLFMQATSLLHEIDETQSTLDSLHIMTPDQFQTNAIRTGHVNHKIYEQDLIDKLVNKNQQFNLIHAELIRISPGKAHIIQNPTPKNEPISCALPPDTIFMNIFQGEAELSIVLSFPDGFTTHSTLSLSRQEGLEQVLNTMEFMKTDNHVSVRSHDFLRRFKIPMGKLYDQMFKPIKPLFKKFRRIIISPHFFWHYFPFHILFDKKEQCYLCDQLEIGYAPSAGVLQHCMKNKHPQRNSTLILSRNNGDLPHITSEVERISAACQSDKKSVFSNDNAFLSRAESSEQPYDIIHLACHGYFNQEQPFLSGIDIAPSKNESRKTYLLDFYNTHLDCNLITLSACESGLSQISVADELVGFSRGLFFAGAASVMLSLWQVADNSTSSLMENFYWHYIQNKSTKTRALQLAMQAIRSHQEYAHPFYWAPFVVMGDWR